MAGPPVPAPPADDALASARAIAADWRAAGLRVGLVEHASRDGRPDGCVLVARSPARVLHCACRPAISRDGRALWAVEVSVGRCEDDLDGIEHVRLRTVGTAVAEACGPAWRQAIDWLHGGDPLEAGPEAAPVPLGWWRGWAAGAARCRSRLRAAIGRHLVAPDLAGVADRLRWAASPPRWTGVTRCRVWLGRHLGGPGLAALASRPDWPRGAAPLLKGGLVGLAGAAILAGSVCLAGWRFARRDEQAYRAYARMCAAAVQDGAAAEDEFWCKRARELRLLYRFAEADGAAGR